MSNVRIYILVSEGQEALFTSDLCVPLYVGRGDEHRDGSFLSDNEGDNIAHYYEKWGILTGLYWVWKNSTHQTIGVASRRRLLSLAGGWERDGSVTGCDPTLLRRHRWSLGNAASLLSIVDVVHPYRYSVEEITVSQEIISPYQFYQTEGGTAHTLNLILDIIKEQFPDIYLDAVEFVYGERMIPWNHVIMRRDIFDEYCYFIFSILFELDKKKNVESKNMFQRDIWSLIAEILGNIYLKYLKKKDPSLAFLEAPLIYIEDACEPFNRKEVVSRVKNREKKARIRGKKEIKYGGRVNLILSFDDGYLKPACALLNSILAHTANGEEIDFYILHDEALSREVQEKLIEFYHKRTTLYFIQIDKFFVGHFPLNRKHININSYYRLLIHNNVPTEIERVIYLDADMIVCDDIVDLWNYDIGTFSCAAVQDEEGILESYRLFEKDFNHSYVNAGVMIFNLQLAKKKYGNLDFLYVESFYKFKNRINLQDQDILNIAYKNDIFLLPLRWNLSSASYKLQKDIEPCSGLEDHHAYAFSLQEEQHARLDPAILHYTGRRKPWKFLCPHYLKSFYWRYYLQTPGVRLSLKERLCCWNHYLNIRRGTVTLSLFGYRYSWSFLSIIGYWKSKFLWWKKWR